LLPAAPQLVGGVGNQARGGSINPRTADMVPANVSNLKSVLCSGRGMALPVCGR
jgi:hypothetical protein